MSAYALTDVRGFVVALPHVRCVYPISKEPAGYEWGFKFTDGFFETFTYRTEEEAKADRDRFLLDLENHYRSAS